MAQSVAGPKWTACYEFQLSHGYYVMQSNEVDYRKYYEITSPTVE